MPVIECFPESPSPSREMTLVIREIDRYLASQDSPEADVATAEANPIVLEVRQLLAGQTVVLIGGECRAYSRKKIEVALGLKELVWITTREHESIDTFDAPVSRDDVSVVVLAIRWSSHSFGEVKQFCDRYGKPLVRLPGGYNPVQIAAQILTQCSERLLPRS